MEAAAAAAAVAGTNMLVDELTQGQGLARELESQLDSASLDLCRSLAHDILASIDKAISMAKSSNACYTDGSPRSETSDPPFRLADRKKRKTQPKWTTQLKLGSGPEADGPLDDGYSWRKYGQKEILGAKHPRAYYRCTHRNTQGCPAMKQVQRSDPNPAIFLVTYRGTHTCRPKPSPSPAPSLVPNLNLNYHHSRDSTPLLLSFQNTLKVETDCLQYHEARPPSSPFSFPSTPADGTSHDGRVFSPGSTPDGCPFKRGFTDAFISPDTSESDFTDMISAVASPTDSYTLDFDFLLQPSSEIDADFRFDAASFFS